MPLSVDDIVAKFPVKILPTITGEPDYEAINQLVQTLYGNAASLATTLGGGGHGHIGIIMTTPLYATLTATPYIAPIDPGAIPNIPPGASSANRDIIRTAHTEARRIFDNHTNMDDALKSQVIDTINDTYICEMRNKYTGYLGITTRDLLDHILDRYGKITPADIEECKRKMIEPIDSTQPIDIFFQRIDDCVQYADDGQVAFTAEQILQTAYHAISTSGFYNDACKEWRKKAVVDKTWTNFKTFFAAEYHDLKEQQKVNTSQTNFHGANAAIDISSALDNLAMAATTDRDIVAQLTLSNTRLTEANKILAEQLKNSMEANLILLKKPGNNPRTPNTPKTPTTTGTRQPFDQATWEANLDPTGYCWSHGYRVQKGHSSANCKGKLGGHQDAATRDNTMGGATKGKT
jgi:cell division septum initiation protein DivIVA